MCDQQQPLIDDEEQPFICDQQQRLIDDEEQ
jgi:hypothetical protein